MLNVGSDRLRNTQDFLKRMLKKYFGTWNDLKFLSEVTGCQKTQVSDRTGSTVIIIPLLHNRNNDISSKQQKKYNLYTTEIIIPPLHSRNNDTSSKQQKEYGWFMVFNATFNNISVISWWEKEYNLLYTAKIIIQMYLLFTPDMMPSLHSR